MYSYYLNSGVKQQASVLILVVMTLTLMVTIAVGFMSIVSNQQGNSVAVALQTYADITMQESESRVIRLLNESMKEIKNKDDKTVGYTSPTNLPARKAFLPLIDEDADPMTDDDRRPRHTDDSATLRPTTSGISAHPLINTNISIMDMRHASTYKPKYYRWYNTAWLSTDLERIEIDPSLPQAERTKRMKSARYVARYTAQIADTSGYLSMNNNFPDSLSDGSSINRGNASEDGLHYIRQQNYLRNFGRSLKSMVSSGFGNDVRQARPQLRGDMNMTRNDPLDLETVSITDHQHRLSMQAGSPTSDVRTDAERIFRSGDLNYGGVPNYNIKGRQYTWLQASSMAYGYMGIPFTPYADSMRDKDLADLSSGEPVSAVSTPWRVNMLTASGFPVLRIMMNGLSADAKLDHIRFHNANLFGMRYPEPFPLAFDAGRSNTFVAMSHRREGNGIYGGGWGGEGYRHSYINDAMFALSWAIQNARTVWADENDLPKQMVSAGTYIDPLTLNDTDEMLRQVIRETYRIVGEHTSNLSVGSVESGSFLAGDEVIVGEGYKYRGLSRVHPSENTRAMEYFLNDLMISLFGKANPDFNVGDDIINDSIALDFNQDGYVESTVTGWYDHSLGQKTWSWWWDGLGPYVRVAAGDDYMKRAGWYRFVEGDSTPYRKIGGEWKAVPDAATFYKYNDLWLKQAAAYPIKPFSKTGRLYIGKSRYFCAFIRSEVYDIVKESTVAAVNRKVWYMIDPNHDGDYSDNALLLRGEMTIEVP